METLVILPNQLFEKKYIIKNYNIIIWEHPHYFTTYNYNKKKLLLHRASMKSYYNYLKKYFKKVKYIEYKDKLPEVNYTIYDPIDKIKLPNNPKILESPNYLLNKEKYKEYRNKKTSKFYFYTFFKWAKNELNIIPNMKSYDKENRKRVPSNLKIPKLPKNNYNIEIIKEAKKYINKNFPNNYGNTNNFIYPITHSQVKKWLKDFIKERFKNFGAYEDYIDEENNYLFHSVLSSSMNIGLINPLEIIEEIKRSKSKIPINSYEGFIRQLFWREFQRFIYIYNDFSKLNYFSNNIKLNKKWYNGTIGIEPVDHCIIKGFETGYLHHIERLMVIGNYMNLSGIKPTEGHRWFMEFSIDSYLWVMHQNVYDMVFFVTGGETMKRPYISSSNYILKMSNIKRGDWVDKWDKLYYDFLKKNKKKLWKFRYYFKNLDKL